MENNRNDGNNENGKNSKNGGSVVARSVPDMPIYFPVSVIVKAEKFPAISQAGIKNYMSVAIL